MKLVAVSFGVSVVAVLLLGCGGSGDYGSPKAAFESMISAARNQDEGAVMDCFDIETRSYLEELEELSADMKTGEENPDFTGKFQAADPEFGAENIDGDKATLEVVLDGKKEVVKFIREGGDWKISIPELKMAVEMMKNMGGMMQEMMEGMTEEMSENMEQSMEDLGKQFEKAMKKQDDG